MIRSVLIQNIGDNLNMQLFTFLLFAGNVEKYLREKSC